MARRYEFDYFGFPPSTPKEVKGGIKAQSKRGAFAEKWWGKRWVEALESFRLGARLSRGRSYARRGQVTTLNVEKGRVAASVQGSRSEAYNVNIRFRTYTKNQWDKIVEQLRDQPIFAAQLLSSEMPAEIESVFHEAGLPLFPEKKGDLTTACSCPDPANPCKHIAAVFYLMAEAFDADPFQLFQLRGMDRVAFLEELRAAGASEQGEAESRDQAPGAAPEPEPLPRDASTFWGRYEDVTMSTKQSPPRLHAALPKRIGNLPFWRSDKDFLKEMTEMYRNASDYIQLQP